MSQTDPESRGLDLFDEKASAVRGFLTVLRGYDKKAVDDYVRDMEQQLSVAKQRYRDVQRELTAVNLRKDDTDFSKLGAHTASLLRVAESQAKDLVGRAETQAEALLAEARERAAAIRLDAEQAVDQRRLAGVEELHALRTELDRQTKEELNAARAEATGLREAADQHRAMVIEDAEHQAASLVETARTEAEHLVKTAELKAAQLTEATERELAAARSQTAEELAAARTRAEAEVAALRSAVAEETEALRVRTRAEAAELRERVALEATQTREQALAEAHQIRTELAQERETSLAALEADQRAARDKFLAMTNEARTQSTGLQETLAQAATDLRARQQAAYAEAERIKTEALDEAAAIMSKAQHDADQFRQETEGALVRRSEQLQREQNLLRQRKEALVAQLNNLSSLANLTALEFPDEEAQQAGDPVMAFAERIEEDLLDLDDPTLSENAEAQAGR